MKNVNRALEIHKQADLLTQQVRSLREYVKHNGQGLWQDVVMTELACVLDRLAIIEHESVAEFNTEFKERMAG